MQAFLKKIFRKDVVAITKNVTGVIFNWLHNLWHDKIVIGFNNITTQLSTWFEKIITQFKTWLHNTKKQAEKMKNKTAMIVSSHNSNKLTTTAQDARFLIPIIVYQPGKVGSITVQRSLNVAFEKLSLSTPVYHAHNLNRIEIVEESIKKSRKDPAPTLKQLAESKALRQQIDSNRSQKWNIISLVRDPVALRVSTMFQVLGEYIPNWAELEKENKLSMQDLQQLLRSHKEFDPAFLAGWFNNQVKGLFDFDVFSTPFDTEKGFKIYKSTNSRFSFMIIRLEDLDRVAPDAFKEFLGLDQFEVINQNIGDEKPYSQLYKQFKSTPLSPEYLEAAYNTQYARHFYTPQEREAFRSRWLNKGSK